MYCYLIMAENKTYIGITNNLEQRLRKHNGEITGGAKSTRCCKNWSYHTVLSGFSDKSNAGRFEWYWKHYRNKHGKWTRTKSGLKHKMARLIELLLHSEWNNIRIGRE